MPCGLPTASASHSPPSSRDRRTHEASPSSTYRRSPDLGPDREAPRRLPELARAALRHPLVGGDDLLHEAVAHDVALAELDEANAADVAQDLARLDQAGGLPERQVDLRDVAGDHRLRAVTEARQEHLHLLAGGVLRLVEDDEGIVQ